MVVPPREQPRCLLLSSEEERLVYYRGTSLIRNSVPLGPYSSNMPGALWRPRGGGYVVVPPREKPRGLLLSHRRDRELQRKGERGLGLCLASQTLPNRTL